MLPGGQPTAGMLSIPGGGHHDAPLSPCRIQASVPSCRPGSSRATREHEYEAFENDRDRFPRRIDSIPQGCIQYLRNYLDTTAFFLPIRYNDHKMFIYTENGTIAICRAATGRYLLPKRKKQRRRKSWKGNKSSQPSRRSPMAYVP